MMYDNWMMKDDLSDARKFLYQYCSVNNIPDNEKFINNPYSKIPEKLTVAEWINLVRTKQHNLQGGINSE